MKWKRGYRSENVQDRRRVGAGAAAVGGGGIIAVLLALFFGGGGGGGGIDLESILGDFGQAPQGNAQAPERQEGPDPDEDLRSISEFTLDDVQNLWTELFGAGGQQYPEAQMVLFTGATSSGCGSATSAIGPHYCPLDQIVYIDLEFFRQLETRFGAAGDFAEAYVIAHEVGHHVQNVTGIMDQVREVQRSSPSEANEYSVRLELQADCLAGVWARSAYQDSLLEAGDLEEAIGAASAVGDDRIQQRAGGMVNPETWTHGSAAQRVEWFQVGFDTGDPNRCDTFSVDV
jgi:predicted metalloprotease